MNKQETAEIAKMYATNIASAAKPDEKLREILAQIHRKYSSEDAQSLAGAIQSALKKLKIRGSNEIFLTLDDIFAEMLSKHLDDDIQNENTKKEDDGTE